MLRWNKIPKDTELFSSDSLAMNPAQTFAPIQPPQLCAISRHAIIKFLAEREHYENAVTVQPGLTPLSWAQTIEPKFLRSLIKARVFGREITVASELSDILVSQKLHDLAGGYKSVSWNEAIADVKKHCKLDAREPDARLRIIMLTTSYIDLCESRNWNFVENAPKAAVRHLTEVLQPPELKTAIIDGLRLEKEKLKDDFFGFCEWLQDEAVSCEKYNPLQNRHRIKSRNDYTQNGRSASHDKNEKRELPLCLNPKCSEKHYMKYCKNTSEELKKKLVEERKAKFAKQKAEKRFPAVSAVITPTGQDKNNSKTDATTSSNIMFAHISKHTVACRIDSGADVTVVSENIVQFLNAQDMFLPTKTMSTPIKLVAVDGSILTTATQIAVSPILQTIAGPCRLRNLRPYVIPCHDDTKLPGASCGGELVLGNDFLKISGLDMKDFVTNRIELLAEIDYGKMSDGFIPGGTVGSLGKKLLQDVRIASTAKHEQPLRNIHHSQPKPTDGSIVDYRDWLRNDGDDIDYKDVNTGSQDKQELDDAIEGMLERASKHTPQEKHSELKDLVYRFRDVFRTTIGDDPPVDVTPMVIEFEGERKPIRVKQRMYSPAQTVFLKNKCTELQKLGLVRTNSRSEWACAPLVVPKPGKESFRFTVDLRPVNAQTKVNIWPMPNIEALLARISGSKFYSSLDLIHAYWQMPLSEESQECMSFHSPLGILTPNRVLHGARNAVAYFQFTMDNLFDHLAFLKWLDDLLGYAKTIDELLKLLAEFLSICAQRRLKLNPSKCELVTTRAKFCGRVIDHDGYRFNPRNYAALTNMEKPTTTGALIQLVHGANWLRSAIPCFAELIDPLHKLLEDHYKTFKSRKKSRIGNRPLQYWDELHEITFKKLIEAIIHQVTLTAPNAKQRLCLFTDASNTHWAGVLTQVPCEMVSLLQSKPDKWDHHPVAFVSGSFIGAAARWSTPEKESYAVVSSVTRLSHVLASVEEFSLFTDHKNLLYMYSPTRYQSNVARHVVHKTQRWAIRMSEFNYVIEHIAGEDNIWADMLTRWAAPTKSDYPARRVGAIKAPALGKENPELPTLEEIKRSQEQAPPQDDKFVLRNGYYRNNKGQLYIPPSDEQLQLRIIVAAHCGLGGHRGTKATSKMVLDYVYWPTVKSDIQAFLSCCLVCLLSESSEKIPRPLGNQQHASKVGELLHFDYLYIGDSATSEEYILILKDDFSGYCYLKAFKSANAENTTTALLEYFSLFTPVLLWFSDRGSHFCNDVMVRLASSLQANHSFSTAYVPWSNGTVEAVCKQVIRVLRVLTVAFKVPEANWPSLVRGCQSIINNSPSRRLNGYAPITVHTGQKPGNPLSIALADTEQKTVSSEEHDSIVQKLQLEDFFISLDNMHKKVSETLSKERTDAVTRHNQKTHVREFNPSVGDYVVVARTSGPKTKLSTKWVGPRRITALKNAYVVEIEHLLTNKTAEVHISRVRPYVDSLVGKRTEFEKIAEYTDIIWHSIRKIKNHRETSDGNFELLISWKGLSETGDTWEPLPQVFEDAPTLVHTYFSKSRNNRAARKAKASIGI